MKLGADGTLLVICRSGCDNNAVRMALGMEWSEFFPEKSTGVYERKLAQAFPAADILQALADESMVVAVVACNIGLGVELTPVDKARLLLAFDRISAARRMALGER